MTPTLSVVVLNWNVAELLAACLDSLREAADEWWPHTEVIVVDNASTDGSVAMLRTRFPDVRVIALPANKGFAVGNNVGILASRCEYIFLLNPDTVAHPGSIAALAEYMAAHPEVGIVGPRLLNPDGSLQSSRRRFPTLATALLESTPLQKWFEGATALRDFYMLDSPDGETQEVDWLSGAALMCRREALWQAGLFDPRYFMFSEEVDLCRRVSDAGWSIVYLPEAVVTHYGGQSTGQDVPARHIHFNTSKARYFRLHEGRVIGKIVRLYLLGVYALQLLSEGAKWMLGHKRPLRAERVKLYTRVLRSGLRESRTQVSHEKHVLLITGEYPPARGGVGDYTCCLESALQKEGVCAQVLTKDQGSGVSGQRSVGTFKSQYSNLKTLLAPRITLPATLRALRGSGSQIAHIQYQTGAYEMRPTVNLLPLLLRRRWGGATLVTFHDLRVPYLFPKAGPVREWANRLLARTVGMVIATNPDDAARLRSWGVQGVRLIPIGSNIPNNPPEGYSREGWRAAHNVPAPADTILLAYFGFLNSTKGLDDLLRALVTLKGQGNYRLMMVGGGLGSSDPTNRETARSVDNLARELGVHEELIWMGYLSQKEVSAALLAADMAVLPFADGASFRRGSLLAVLEHGLPLITTTPQDEETHSALSTQPAALLVPPGDVAALTEAIKRLAQDSRLRATLSAGARELARSFSWETIAEMHTRLYDELLG